MDDIVLDDGGDPCEVHSGFQYLSINAYGIDDAQIVKVQQDLRAIESALKLYRLDNFRYPDTERGLDALVTPPQDPNARWPAGGYLDRLPKDPWNRPYIYLYPGNQGEFDIYSLGRDGQQGGEGLDGDLGNWSLD